MPRSMLWQVGVLLAQPPLSAAYLFAMRASIVAPSYAAAFLFVLLPAVVLAAGSAAYRKLDDVARRSQAGLLALAVLEVAWGVLIVAIVGFAGAWRLE